MATAEEIARAAGITLREGVYAWYSGPNFETPAEIKMAKLLGADLDDGETLAGLHLALLVTPVGS